MRDAAPELVERIRAAFERRCLGVDAWISADGRIGEQTAAALLGWSHGSLVNRRAEGTGPPHYKVGGAGNRISYALHELAEWVAAHRCE